MYEILRACHILSVMAWIAGLLMLPRLLVYRLEGRGQTALEASMDKAARRLQKIILTPAMLLSWLFGLLLLSSRFSSFPPWLWGKLALALALTAIHAKFTVWRRLIAKNENPVCARKLRLWNELPFIITIFIVLLAVLEPWKNKTTIF